MDKYHNRQAFVAVVHKNKAVLDWPFPTARTFRLSIVSD